MGFRAITAAGTLKSRHEKRDILKSRCVDAAQRIRGKGRHRQWHVLGIFGSPLCRDDNFFEARNGCWFNGGLSVGAPTMRKYDGDNAGQNDPLHGPSPPTIAVFRIEKSHRSKYSARGCMPYALNLVIFGISCILSTNTYDRRRCWIFWKPFTPLSAWLRQGASR